MQAKASTRSRDEFLGQVAIVTGAGHGLGQAMAGMLAELGAVVHGADLAADELWATQQLIEAADPGAFVPRTLDVRDSGAWEAWVDEIADRHDGQVDILINNAGGVAGQVHHPIEQVSDEAWAAVMEANLGGAFRGIRAVAPLMKARAYGRIVNITSGAGRSWSLTGIQAYTSTKAGEIGLTRQMAFELGPHGITVNAIAPGFIRSNPATERQWRAMSPEEQRRLVSATPVGRLGTPQDIAWAVRFLVHPQSDFITGQVLSVDGGHQMF
ncbi:MAG: SDR family NAD(P)-dependent oxidoreductase [Thermaerobacter sp.]|nr:SDR family NAD(P)-dependent oxidoreductase [Thermaerobacter sp.]